MKIRRIASHQGSVLGPVLFLVYVNHVVQRLTCNFKIFADDIKLYISNTPLESTANVEALQQDIDTLSATSSSWGLEMNISKCVCLRFGPRSVGGCSDGDSPYNLNGVTSYEVFCLPQGPRCKNRQKSKIP